MRRYSAADEERIRTQSHVREWTRAGLLDPSQGARLETELRVDLRRTGRMLRAGLALFTALVVGASVGLVIVVLDLNDDGAVGVMAGLAGAACMTAADLLADRYRLYRHGVEETLAVFGVALLAISAGMVTRETLGRSHGTVALMTALLVGTAVSLATYRRFGFRYAAVAAMACAALVPFQFPIGSPFQRLLAAAVLASTFVVAREMRSRHPDDFLGDDAATFEAAALVGVYVAVNLYATPELIAVRAGAMISWFKWTSYVMTWMIPAVGLFLGIREKERMLIDAGVATALVTIITNKPYLGLPRQTWDPMLLGVLLVGVAIGVRGWLARGPAGERGGYTPVRLLESEQDAVGLAGIASAGFQPASDRPAPAEPTGFGGGRSGGGGAGGEF